MWMEKLSSGVLRILTPLGPRYLKPSFLQRAYLLWTFRHFQTLPVKVLSPRQLHLVDALCTDNRFVSLNANPFEDAPIIGTLEQRPPIEAQSSPRPPSASVAEAVAPFAADSHRRS
jgi:hypothetical protein